MHIKPSGDLGLEEIAHSLMTNSRSKWFQGARVMGWNQQYVITLRFYWITSRDFLLLTNEWPDVSAMALKDPLTGTYPASWFYRLLLFYRCLALFLSYLLLPDLIPNIPPLLLFCVHPNCLVIHLFLKILFILLSSTQKVISFMKWFPIPPGQNSTKSDPESQLCHTALY